MVDTKFRPLARILAIAVVLLTVAGCETNQFTKRIDYKSAQSAPQLELPPDLTTPQYDDRFSVTTASGLAAQGTRPKAPEVIAPDANAEARIARAGTQRWLVVKTTSEIAWNTTKEFWTTTGFVIAVDQPTLGIMETDWAENRADVPNNWLSSSLGKYVDIYISHRGSEQVPTASIDRVSPAGWTWAVMPPDPGLEAEMLSRLMQRFGTTEAQAKAAVQGSSGANAPERARLEKMPNGASQLVVDDNFDRAWRRVGLALDRVGFTVVDRDRSKGTYFVRYANPESDGSKGKKGFLDSLMFWKDKEEKPEQYRITVAEANPNSLVTVQDPDGAPDKSVNGEKILALLKDQLK